MSQRESLEVRMDDRLVGTLALTANHKVAFSYSEEWLEHGFSVSPFSLPLKNEVFVPKKDYFKASRVMLFCRKFMRKTLVPQLIF